MAIKDVEKLREGKSKYASMESARRVAKEIPKNGRFVSKLKTLEEQLMFVK